MGFVDLLDRRPAELTVGTRPRYIKEGKSKYTIAEKVEGIEPFGGNILVRVIINKNIKTTSQLEKWKKVGDDIVPNVDTEKIHVFDKRPRDMITNPV